LRSTNAPTILARYRRELVKLANEYARVVGPEPRARKRLALRICAAVTHHVQILEELCFPSVGTALDVQPEVAATGAARHAHLRQLAGQVETATPEDPQFDANVRALLLALSVYLAWEETEFVPRMFASDTNLEALAMQITVRSRELRAAYAIRRPALPSAG
jgi:hypothetical protein